MPTDTNLLIVGNKPSNRWTDQIESETMNVVKIMLKIYPQNNECCEDHAQNLSPK